MTPESAAQTLRQRRQRLRRQFQARLREAQLRVDQLPQMQRSKAQRAKTRRRLLALVAILLLICISRCSCTPEPATLAPPAPAPASTPAPATPKLKRRGQAAPKLSVRQRGKYAAEAPMEPAWVEAFRLQVAARSQRLAECFTGAVKPGALRWTAALNPDTGAVADHELEPLPPSDPLTPAQHKCTVKVLSNPHYGGLVSKYVGTLPENVSLVLEF